MAVVDDIRSEWQEMKHKTLKEKFRYFMDYYK